MKTSNPPLTWKSSLLRLLPRSVEKFLRRLFGRPAHVPEEAGEKSATWYDRAFEEAADYSAHYTRSPYYVSWTVIIDRVRRARATSVLEVACGPGQLACALRDAGLLQKYVGFDFAAKRVEAARKSCPDYTFLVADAFATPLFEAPDYEVVIATEFLEHVHEDLRVLERVRSGARFIGTVPNYPYVSHVRHFVDEAAVRERYAPYFTEFSVASIVRDRQGNVLYLIEGIKR